MSHTPSAIAFTRLRSRARRSSSAASRPAGGGGVGAPRPARAPAAGPRCPPARAARLEVPLDVDHADGQQARPLVAQRPLGAFVYEYPTARGLRVLEPQLEARLAPLL